MKLSLNELYTFIKSNNLKFGRTNKTIDAIGENYKIDITNKNNLNLINNFLRTCQNKLKRYSYNHVIL